MKEKTIILGAGITGLGAGWSSKSTVHEARERPGGICSSYYLRPGDPRRLHAEPSDGEAYRFETGGGHWIFGCDETLRAFLGSIARMGSYRRNSAVFFPETGLFVPYPIQNHLRCLGKDIARRALSEMAAAPRGTPRTLAEWLEWNFGRTLTDLFFGPFHDAYTAGLWTRIAPQDAYKSPVNLSLAAKGAGEETPPVGYNSEFLYPPAGMNALIDGLASGCDIRFLRRVEKIDTPGKEVIFSDGSGEKYERLLSTLPLKTVMDMTSLDPGAEKDPHTSVLVLNVGAEKGPDCPDHHWLYIPRSRSGFHRVGFYSNVDNSFLPSPHRQARDRVAAYVERAYRGGARPSEEEIHKFAAESISELREWGFIGDVEVSDATWVEFAYTWSMPDSPWREESIRTLRDRGIIQLGRYGRWVFQGIAESLREGMSAGAAAKGGVH